MSSKGDMASSSGRVPTPSNNWIDSDWEVAMVV
jgi:hypothetical protein